MKLGYDTLFMHNHTHNLLDSDQEKLEKLSFMSSVKGTYAEVNQLNAILCTVEDWGWDLLKEKRALENDKS